MVVSSSTVIIGTDPTSDVGYTLGLEVGVFDESSLELAIGAV